MYSGYCSDAVLLPTYTDERAYMLPDRASRMAHKLRAQSAVAQSVLPNVPMFGVPNDLEVVFKEIVDAN